MLFSKEGLFDMESECIDCCWSDRMMNRLFYLLFIYWIDWSVSRFCSYISHVISLL